MTLKRNTVLVLGAGASYPYGFPLGSQLRLEIIRMARPENYFDWKSIFGEELIDFVREFQFSQTTSIDAFLARRPEFEVVGKKAIAAILLGCESYKKLLEDEPDSHWYRHLFNYFTAVEWEMLDFSKLKIITFNYDRSLEHYFFAALQHAYGKSDKEVLLKLATLQINHIYGSLGPPLPGDSEYFSYEGGANADRVESAAKWLRVIPEGRNTDDVVQSAQKWLFYADAIAFLGFGYDQANLERLGHDQATCLRKRTVDGARRYRPVVGSCLGMTPLEVRRVAANICGTADLEVKPFPDGFIPGDCLDTLRQTLILG